MQDEQTTLFGSGMANAARIVHFASVTGSEDRRKTIETLIALAADSNPASCWDDQRAQELLRRESTAEECRELGMSEAMIEHIFGGDAE